MIVKNYKKTIPYLIGIILLTTFGIIWLHFGRINIQDSSYRKISEDFDYSTLHYFSLVAFGAEFSQRDFKLSRWENPEINFSVVGNPKTGDLEYLFRVVDTLNSLLMNSQLIYQKDSNAEVEIKIYFLNMDELVNMYPRYRDNFNIGGFVDYRKRIFGGDLKPCRIVLNTDFVKVQTRRHVILEELTQSLGLLRDVDLYDHSIFSESVSRDTVLAKIDKDLIRLLYNYDLPIGLQRDTFRKLFAIKDE